MRVGLIPIRQNKPPCALGDAKSDLYVHPASKMQSVCVGAARSGSVCPGFALHRAPRRGFGNLAGVHIDCDFALFVRMGVTFGIQCTWKCFLAGCPRAWRLLLTLDAHGVAFWQGAALADHPAGRAPRWQGAALTDRPASYAAPRPYPLHTRQSPFAHHLAKAWVALVHIRVG